MKLKNQVINLDYARKLAELGVKRESLWYWIQNFRHSTNHPYPGEKPEVEYFWIGNDANTVMAKQFGYVNFPAYTLHELGEMLPKKLLFKFGDGAALGSLTFYHFDGDYYVDYMLPDSGETLDSFTGQTEIDARANAVIKLIKLNLLTARQINEAV